MNTNTTEKNTTIHLKSLYTIVKRWINQRGWICVHQVTLVRRALLNIKPNQQHTILIFRFIYLKAGHISTSHLDTLVYNNNSVHCNTKFYSDNTHTVYNNQTIHSFLSSTRQRAAYPLPHSYRELKSKQNIKVLAGIKGLETQINLANTDKKSQ